MASLGSDLPSAVDSTHDSACDGLIVVAEALERFRIWQPSGCLTLRRCCARRAGRRWFPESTGSPRPAAPPWDWGAVLSPPRTVGVIRGVRFLGRAVGPVCTWGSAPERAALRRVAAQPCGVWLARGETRQWANVRLHVMRARAVQMRIREARSRVPHVTSRQDSKCNVQSTSTVHRSPTINPHYL